jgi:hypothetical protein
LLVLLLLVVWLLLLHCWSVIIRRDRHMWLELLLLLRLSDRSPVKAHKVCERHLKKKKS